VLAADPLYVERRDKNIKNISFCSIIGTIFVEFKYMNTDKIKII
jgi:hypothetical protein